MYATTHPNLIGVHLGSSRSDICVWDGAKLAVETQVHKGVASAAVAETVAAIGRMHPRRPSNVVLATSRPDLRLADLGPLLEMRGSIGAAAVRSLLLDGTQCDVREGVTGLAAGIPVSGTVAGALGAFELARSAGGARAVAVDGGDPPHLAFGHELAMRRAADEWCRPPVDAMIDRTEQADPAVTDFVGRTVIPYGPSAGSVAQRARTQGAERVLVPVYACEWHAVALVLIDPIIDFCQDVTVAENELDDRVLRRMYAELMEAAAAGIQAACYEQDDAALYRFIEIEPGTAGARIQSMESAAGHVRVLDRLRTSGSPVHLRLTTRAVIAPMRPSLADLVDARYT